MTPFGHPLLKGNPNLQPQYLHMPNLRIALAQINATVGALSSNARKIVEQVGASRKAGADLVVFPELVISGYPPEDLLLKPAFVQACREHLDKVIHASQGLWVVIGFPEFEKGKLYNSAAVIGDAKLIGTYRKHLLPNYGVFDEQRYFSPGTGNPVFLHVSRPFGVTICEDIWTPEGPHVAQVQQGAKLILNLSSSPYHRSKQKEREHMLAERARKCNVALAYCNLVGGQDELVFDGGSVVLDPAGELLARGKEFEEDLVVVDLSESKSANRIEPLLPELEEIYRALVLGTRDYAEKNGFSQVVLGLSGGIDSALVACAAADAIGPANVTGVSLPSQYSSDHSKHDAADLAKRLGIHFTSIPIESIYATFMNALAPVFRDAQSGIAEENLQSRIRGTLLMALSNKFGWLVLTTGNKSEVSVGYATLYGDMAGGFAVIKDVPKLLVYELAKHRNLKNSVIPENVFQKPPSAELRPNQKDSDSLPDYSVLDPILKAYVEQNASAQEIVAKGFAPEIVHNVIRLVDRAEYKRRQGPPGIKITERALGKDWRLPLTNHFTG